MKSKYLPLYNKYSFFLLYLFLFFSGFLNCTINSISIGKNPFLKKLKNGDYILISSKGIIFLDETLSEELNNINFGSDNDENLYFSTNVEEFYEEHNEYIIALYKNNLYVFSSDKTLLNKTENIGFINPYNCHSIIPYDYIDNELYFAIIFLEEEQSYLKFVFVNTIFNSVSNIIDFYEPVYFTPEELYFDFDSFSCKLIKNNTQNIINCIYGNYNRFILTNFNPYNNFENILYYPINIESSFTESNLNFNSLVIPGKEVAIFCIFTSSNFKCFRYSILTNILS